MLRFVQIVLESLLGLQTLSLEGAVSLTMGCADWSAPAASWRRGVENPKEKSRRNDWRILCVLVLGWITCIKFRDFLSTINSHFI